MEPASQNPSKFARLNSHYGSGKWMQMARSTSLSSSKTKRGDRETMGDQNLTPSFETLDVVDPTHAGWCNPTQLLMFSTNSVAPWFPFWRVCDSTTGPRIQYLEHKESPVKHSPFRSAYGQQSSIQRNHPGGTRVVSSILHIEGIILVPKGVRCWEVCFYGCKCWKKSSCIQPMSHQKLIVASGHELRFPSTWFCHKLSLALDHIRNKLNRVELMPCAVWLLDMWHRVNVCIQNSGCKYLEGSKASLPVTDLAFYVASPWHFKRYFPKGVLWNLFHLEFPNSSLQRFPAVFLLWCIMQAKIWGMAWQGFCKFYILLHLKHFLTEKLQKTQSLHWVGSTLLYTVP